jgi:pyruvate dehydrogenase E1 component alpha subunit
MSEASPSTDRAPASVEPMAGPERYLGADGRPVAALPDIARSREELASLYRAMVLTRQFDQKAVALQRTGRLGTYASSLGQEAVGIGVASAMETRDVLLPSFREQGAQLWRGVTMVELLAYWGGDERGSDFAACREDFPICVPVATHLPHAAGVALAFKHRGEARAAVCIAGDGATSKGDFYEAINVAGLWSLPCVFVIANNQWAISLPRRAQTGAETLAQKAVAAGFAGTQVDGNDVIAVHEATRRALERARSGGGPALIEAITYRLGDHTTADDARRYRDDAEVSPHWDEEPVKRLRQHLVDAHDWGRDDEEALIEDCRQQVDAAASAYEAREAEPASAMFDTLFETLPRALADQRAAAIADAEASDG